MAMCQLQNCKRPDFQTLAIKALENSSGVRLLKSIHWESDEVTLTIFCDACPDGMGFWYPDLSIGFYSPTPSYENPDLLF